MSQLHEIIKQWPTGTALTTAKARQCLKALDDEIASSDPLLDATQPLPNSGIGKLRAMTIGDLQWWEIAHEHYTLEDTGIWKKIRCEKLQAKAKEITLKSWKKTAEQLIYKYSHCPKCGSQNFESKGASRMNKCGVKNPKIYCNDCGRYSTLGPGTKRKHKSNAARQQAYRDRQD